jgi:hypothetical protein
MRFTSIIISWRRETMTTTIEPHGGKLINKYDPNLSFDHLQKDIPLDATSLSDLELMSINLIFK